MYKFHKDISRTIEDKTIRIYQIYFDEKSRGNCFDEWEKTCNVSLTPFFENTIINSLVYYQGAHKDAEWFGIFSHNFRHKTSMDKHMKFIDPQNIIDTFNRGEFEGVDVVGFCRIQNNGKNYFNWAEKVHHGSFLNPFRRLLELLELSVDITKGVRFVTYQNAFLCKGWIYEDYVTKILRPAMKFMNTDPELMDMLWKKTGYKERLPFPKRMENDLTRYYRQIRGRHKTIDYYPVHTFLCERLFSYYLTYVRPELVCKHF